MAKKLVGREGKAFIAPVVTGKSGKGLPISRTTRKQATAQKVLALNLAVDFRTPELTISPYTPNELYRVLRRFGYRWVGNVWQREYPDWVKVS